MEALVEKYQHPILKKHGEMAKEVGGHGGMDFIMDSRLVYCLHLDLKDLQRMAYLLQMCSNNLNQYAKAANENGRVYAADMEDLQQRLDELIEIGRQILSRLADL